MESIADVTAYLLNNAHIAIVPLYAFGASTESPWYRLSVGTADYDEIPALFQLLENALAELH